jgi:hypothetical protein
MSIKLSFSQTYLPVAPEHAPLASNITTFSSLFFFIIVLANAVPVIPLPSTTISTRSGNLAAPSDPWSLIGDAGTCQYDPDGLETGIPGDSFSRLNTDFTVGEITRKMRIMVLTITSKIERRMNVLCDSI